MNVSIHFPAEIERQLQQRAAAAGQDVESFVRQMVTEQLAEEAQNPAPQHASPDEFKARLRRIIDRHPGSRGRMDDSRESIYAGRGE